MLNNIIILITAFICGVMGTYAGADKTDKAWRRFGLTIIYTLYGLIKLWNCWLLSLITIFYPLSKGYGIPDLTDDGSTIGRFFYNIFQLYPEHKRHYYANIYTRFTISLMCILSCISIPIISGRWLEYFIYSMGIIISYVFVSWRNLGTFKFLKKELCWSDMINYTILSLCILKMIG